jgi:hypothetical protein
MPSLVLYVSGFEPLFDEFPTGYFTDGVQYVGVGDVIKRPFDIRIHHPHLLAFASGEEGDVAYCIVAASTGAKTVAGCLEGGFPSRFQGVLDPCLKAPIHHGWYAQRPLLAIRFRDIHPEGWPDAPGLEGHHEINQPSPAFRC